MIVFQAALFFSYFIAGLSSAAAAALGPVSPRPDPVYAPTAHQDTERDLLTLLHNNNTTNPPLTSSSTLNTTNAIEPTCFDDPRAPIIVPVDCYTTLFNLLLDPNVLTLQRYDRTSDLPAEMAYHTCSIMLTRDSARSDATFQPALIAHAAALVVKRCTVAARFRGGWARIGGEPGFLVYVGSGGNGNGVVGASATA